MESIVCIDKCTGCNHTKLLSKSEEEGEATINSYVCIKYANPGGVWTRLGGCPMRTHNKTVAVEEKRYVDPLKASKQKARGVR
jgi:hypothetical protein